MVEGRWGQPNLPQSLAVQGFLRWPVREMLKRPTLRLQGGSPVAQSRARGPDELLDRKRIGPAEIDGLDLQSDVADAARALKTKIPVLGTGAW